MTGDASDANSADVTTITVYPDGPLLVRGPARIRTPQGEEFVNTRAVRALCRCGKSANKPWCDGTHKAARFHAPQATTDPAGTPTDDIAPAPDDTSPDSAGERIEADRERSGASGDELAQAVNRHRDELGMPPEPADGEDVEPDR